MGIVEVSRYIFRQYMKVRHFNAKSAIIKLSMLEILENIFGLYMKVKPLIASIVTIKQHRRVLYRVM